MRTDRRTFLAIAGAMLVGAAASSANAAREPDGPGEPLASDPPVPPLDAPGMRVLHFASLAPNGHNTQPWSVVVHDARHWTIRAVASRRLPAVDPHDRELTLSIGAFTENLVLAAAAEGLEAECAVIEPSAGTNDVLEVHLHEATPRSESLAPLALRRTVRKGHEDREFPQAVVSRLCEPLERRFVYVPRATSQARRLAEWTLEANRQQTWRDDAQRELGAWIRFDDRAAREARDGLSTASMEITGIAGWYVRHFMTPEDALTDSFRARTVASVAELVQQGAGWILVLGDGTSRAGLIETARRFQRMGLRARECGVGIHPMTQILEEEPWRSAIAAELGLAESPQFILRAGFVDPYPPPVSLRRPVPAFVERDAERSARRDRGLRATLPLSAPGGNRS
jgi:hypothetical protein